MSDAGSAPERQSVWGRVVDAAGGALPGAEVFWVGEEHAGARAVGLFDVHKVATADGDGRFWAPGLPAGPCLLVPDFQRMGVEGDEVRIAHATAVTLPRTTDTEEVELVFPHERTEFGSVNGVVRGERDGRPASRLPVALLDASGSRALRRTQTHTNGSFAFSFLPEGSYHLAVWGTLRHLDGSVSVELGRNKRVDCKIGQHRRPDGPRGTVRVRVEDALGLPVAGARVSLAAANLHIAPQPVDADGRVVLDGLPLRPDAVSATAPGYWPAGAVLPPGDLTEPADATIALERTVPLRVAVREAASGRPLRHANVLVTHRGGDMWVWGGVLPPPDAQPKNHRDIHVLPGDLTVRAESPGYDCARLATHVYADPGDPRPLLELRLQARRAER